MTDLQQKIIICKLCYLLLKNFEKAVIINCTEKTILYGGQYSQTYSV